MMFLLPILAAAACMVGQTGSANQSATATPREAITNHVLAPAGKVLGLSVHNNSEKNLGEIGDLLIDPRTGELRYAVLEVGGFLGMGEAQRIVPWAYVQVMPNEKELSKFHAGTSLTEAQVKAAPTFKSGEVYGEDLDRRVEATFGSHRDWAYHGEGKPTFVKASDLKVRLKDATGREIGEVESLVLAPQNACVAYAVLDTAKEAGDKSVAVPWSEIRYAYDPQGKLGANTTIELSRFANAPEYDSKDWKRMSGTPWMNEICSYYSCEPFWKSSRFASARKLPDPKSP